jgi:hypothetical protein
MAPFLDSILVLFRADIESVGDMGQKTGGSLRSIKPVSLSHSPHDTL